MRVDVFLENADDETRELFATFTINGIDEVANYDVAKKEGSSKPRISLSFELTRSGLLQLNKAEAKIDEIYEEVKPKKQEKKKEEKTTTSDKEEETATGNEGDKSSEEEENKKEESEEQEKKEEEKEEKKEEEEEVEKVRKKRTQTYPLFKLDKNFFYKGTMERDQIMKAKDRLRKYEKRDEDKIKTDKAKNDYESIIYAMREWVNEDEN